MSASTSKSHSSRSRKISSSPGCMLSQELRQSFAMFRQRYAVPGMPRVAKATEKCVNLIKQAPALSVSKISGRQQCQRQVLAVGHQQEQHVAVLAQSQRGGCFGPNQLRLLHLLEFGVGCPPFLKLETPFGERVVRMRQPRDDGADVMGRKLRQKGSGIAQFHGITLHARRGFRQKREDRYDNAAHAPARDDRHGCWPQTGGSHNKDFPFRSYFAGVEVSLPI